MQRVIYFICLLLLAGCNPDGNPSESKNNNDGLSLEEAIAGITAQDLGKDIEILASDAFEGRAPSSPGEDKTVKHMVDEFTKLGLSPGAGSGWFQEVPLIEIAADAQMSLAIKGETGSTSYDYSTHMMAWTKRVAEQTKLEASELVFVGYGAHAPEYSWNDYEGLDVKGKTVVMLVNDPGYATADPKLFNGRAMTYYGRWTYKLEEAARQGAEGALIIHEDGAAGYPWAVVSGSWAGPQFDLVAADKNMSRCAVEGWIQQSVAEQLCKNAGLDLATLKGLAAKPGFKAVSLKAHASITVNNTVKQSVSRNVLGLLKGKSRPDEYIMYMAHWDHLGKDPGLEGDQIYNGAVDNASGSAALIEIAEAFSQLAQAPERSIVFMAVTAEEQGLLGSRHYSENPIYAPAQTVAAINMDGLPAIGETRDIEVIGHGNSALDDYISEVAAKQGRTVKPDAFPEKGFFYRSDHLNFAKIGVPAMYAEAGLDMVEGGVAAGQVADDDYLANRYHKPADEYDPSWNMGAAIQDLRLFFQVGYRLSGETNWPNWREGNEFRHIRDASRAGK